MPRCRRPSTRSPRPTPTSRHRCECFPERIHLREVDPNPPGPQSDYRTRWTVPAGIRESDLTPATADMAVMPHLLIFGAAKSGKTTIAHAISRAVCARNDPSQVRFMLADFRSGLLDAVPQSHLLDAGAINRNINSLEEAIKALAANLAKRLPPSDLTAAQLRSRSWWSGPDIVLLVDDWHMIVAASGRSRPWRRWLRCCRLRPTSACTSCSPAR